MVALRILHLQIFLFLIHSSYTLNCATNDGIKENCEGACFRTKEDVGCMTCIGDMSEECRNREFSSTCCCKNDMCNETPPPTEAPALDAPKILGIVAGVTIVVIIIVVIIVVIVVRRKMKKKTKISEYSAVDKNDQSMQMSVSYKQMDSENEIIDHEDLTSQQIQPIMELEDKKELIEAMANPPELPGYDEIQEKPQLKRLITYGTTDAITIIEEDYEGPKEIPTDDKGFCAYVLADMINNGPRQYPFTIETLKRVLKAGEVRFAAEPTLLTVKVPCTIYGDIHGQYSDLHRWLNVNGWPHKRRSLFLGDFVDRGSHGVEVIAMICCLKTVFPETTFVVRGNHEEETLNKAYSFFGEVRKRFNDPSKDDNIYMYFKRVFMHLPLAAIIGKRVLGMHGGISPKLTSLQDIMDIKRPIDDFEVGTLACDLVWSDPDLGANRQQFRPNLDREPKMGIGQLFSSTAVLAACQRLKVDMIVRGHQAPLHGYAKWAAGKLWTLFSAPGYKGDSDTNVNMGACMELNEAGDMIIKQIKVTEEFRKKRIHDVEARMASDRSL